MPLRVLAPPLGVPSRALPSQRTLTLGIPETPLGISAPDPRQITLSSVRVTRITRRFRSGPLRTALRRILDTATTRHPPLITRATPTAAVAPVRVPMQARRAAPLHGHRIAVVIDHETRALDVALAPPPAPRRLSHQPLTRPRVAVARLTRDQCQARAGRDRPRFSQHAPSRARAAGTTSRHRTP